MLSAVYAECHIFVILSDIMLNVVMLSVVSPFLMEQRVFM